MKAKTKRNLLSELMEGVESMWNHREGKITLRTHRIAAPESFDVRADFFVKARNSLQMSRRAFARSTFIPERSGARPSPVALHS
jgi:hypothetical protein